MKKTFALVLLVAPILVHAQTDKKGIFGELFNGFGKTNPEVAIKKALDVARVTKNSDACKFAFSEFNVPYYGPDAWSCDRQVDELLEEMKPEEQKLAEQRAKQETLESEEKRAEAQAKEEQLAKETEFKRRQQEEVAKKIAKESSLAEIRMGKRQAKSFEEAVAAYSAEEGTTLASAPKIRPDGKIYFLAGTIDSAEKNTSSFTALANNGFVSLAQGVLMGRGAGEPKYFYVRLQKSMEAKYYDRAKIGIGFDFVGKYAYNIDYKTVQGQTKSMPVFDAFYFEFWDSKKLQ